MEGLVMDNCNNSSDTILNLSLIHISIVANEEEQKSNSRSRSAKLRIFERNNK